MSTRVLPFIAVLCACAPDVSSPLEIRRFTSGIEGFDTHSYWIDTGKEVVVFDAQFAPALAEALLAEIRAATDAPITHVVVTHPNPDKFNGAAVFQREGATVVASTATAAAIPEVWAYKKAYFIGTGGFTEATWPALPTIDVTFENSLDLDLAGGEVTLHVLNHSGVTTTQTVAVVGDDLIVGDLVAGRAHAWLEGGIVDGAPRPDIAGWLAALDELTTLGSGVVHPGRGEALPVDVAVAEQKAYLTRVDEVVRTYVADLVDPTAALTGDQAGEHYAALTAAAEAAFPDYALAYLVTYGVYGLALQAAAGPRD